MNRDYGRKAEAHQAPLSEKDPERGAEPTVDGLEAVTDEIKEE